MGLPRDPRGKVHIFHPFHTEYSLSGHEDFVMSKYFYGFLSVELRKSYNYEKFFMCQNIFIYGHIL